MAFATINGHPVLEAEIGIPRVGVWHADLEVDSIEDIVGPCTLQIGDGLTLVGTTHRTGSWLQTAKLRMVGGADGLQRAARPVHYRNVNLRTVLADILRTAGETISATSAAAVLDVTFPHWTTIGQSCGRMISALLMDSRLSADVAWRMLPDGTLWVGNETWPDSGLVNVIDYQDIDESPADGFAELGAEAPRLLPGTTLDGRRVSYVEHLMNGATARTLARFED